MYDPNDPRESVIFAVYCALVAFLALGYFFYINRAVAVILSTLVCTYTWRRYNVYIKLGSIQFAPLSGKIMFKYFEYRSANMTLTILRGHITFRYWLRRVRGGGSGGTDEKHPCRIKIRLDGFEWFLYNRTAAYDYVTKVLDESDITHSEQTGAAETDRMLRSTVNERQNNIPQSEAQQKSERRSIIDKLLPFELVGRQGSISLGNPDIQSICIVQYKEVSGVYYAGQPPSLNDFLRYTFKPRLKGCKVTISPNADYREPSLNQAARLRSRNSIPFYMRLPLVSRMLSRRGMGSSSNIPLESAEPHWAGLERYRSNPDSISRRASGDEYAKVEQMIEAETIDIAYYVDTPGTVQTVEESDEPQWGVELTLKKATVNYGPWTDRQRRLLIDFFFPATYRHATASPKTAVGELRQHRKFKLSFKFLDKCVLRIPTREVSKDWRYHEGAVENDRSKIKSAANSARQFGWIDCKFTDASFIDFEIPFIYDASGSSTIVRGNLVNVLATTSVNYATFFQSSLLKFEGELHSPLKWNGDHQTDMSIILETATVYLLWDHITLIQDIVKDFSAGPTVDHLYFIPTMYNIKFNIFNAGAFLPEDSKKIGAFDIVTVDGSYKMHKQFSANHTDLLKLNFKVANLELVFTGFLLQSVLDFVGNYFGDYSEAITIEEYRGRLSDPERLQKDKRRKESSKFTHTSLGISVGCTRLYGAKPNCLAYASDWQFVVGDINGEIDAPFVFGLVTAINSFLYHYQDRDDMLPSTPSPSGLIAIDCRVESIDIVVAVGNSLTKIAMRDGIMKRTPNAGRYKNGYIPRMQANIPNEPIYIAGSFYAHLPKYHVFLPDDGEDSLSKAPVFVPLVSDNDENDEIIVTTNVAHIKENAVHDVQKGSTTCSVRFGPLTQVIVTPYMLLIVEEALNSQHTIMMKPEYILDEFQISWLENLTKYEMGASRMNLVLNITIPKLLAKTYQSVRIPTLLSETKVDEAKPLVETGFCFAEVSVKDLQSHFRRFHKEDSVDFEAKASFETLVVILQHFGFSAPSNVASYSEMVKSINTPLYASVPRSTVLQLMLPIFNMQAKMVQDATKKKKSIESQAKCDFMVFEVTEIAVETLYGALTTWSNYFKVMQHSMNLCQNDRREAIQRILCMVLDEARKSPQPLKDPAFLVAPSALWTMCKHRPWQNNIDWKLLWHFRSCSLIASANYWEPVVTSTTSPNFNMPLEDFIEKLRGWRPWESGDLTKSPLLHSVFTSKTVRQSTSGVSGPVSTETLIFASFKWIEIKILGDGIEESTLSIETVDIKSKGGDRSLALIMEKLAKASFSVDVSDYPQTVFDIISEIDIHRISVIVNTHTLKFLQHFLRVLSWSASDAAINYNFNESNSSGPPSGPIISLEKPSIWSALVKLHSLELTAHDRMLDLSTQISSSHFAILSMDKIFSSQHAHLCSSEKNMKPISTYKSISARVSEVALTLCERTIRHQDGSMLPHSSLFSLNLHEIVGQLSIGYKAIDGTTQSCMAFNTKLVQIGLPKSLLALQSFVETHGDENIREYVFIISDILAESSQLDARQRTASLPDALRVDLTIDKVDIKSSLLESLICMYSVNQVLVTMCKEKRGEDPYKTWYGGAIQSHKLLFETSQGFAPKSKDLDNIPGRKLLLPGASFDGFIAERGALLDGQAASTVVHFNTTVNVEIVDGSLDVDLLDQLITTQSRLGAEISEITEIFLFYTKRGGLQSSSPVSGSLYEYDIAVNFAGLGVSFKTPSAVIYIESKDIYGSISSVTAYSESKTQMPSLKWKFSLNGFGISLFDQSDKALKQLEMPLASISTDFTFQNSLTHQSFAELYAIPESVELYYAFLNKFHGVVHPMAVEKLVSLMLYFNSELELRRDRKVHEIEAIKDSTERFLTSINVPLSVRATKQFFDDKAVILEIKHFALAMPLDKDDIGVSARSNERKSAEKAERKLSPTILLSARDICVLASKLASSGGQIRDLCLQCIEAFDKTNEKNFFAASHNANNRILLQDIDAKFDQNVVVNNIFGSITAGIKGFDLQVDASVIDYVNCIVHVYETRKSLVMSAIPVVSRNRDIGADKNAHAPGGTQSSDADSMTEFAFICNLEFQAGKCRLLASKSSRSKSELPNSPKHLQLINERSRQTSATSFQDNDGRYDNQVIYLPGVSFFIEGKIVFGGTIQEKTIAKPYQFVNITQTIHPSENILYPSIIQFAVDFMSNLDVKDDTEQSGKSADRPAEALLEVTNVQHFAVNYFLKLAQTKVGLSCQPVSKVSFTTFLEEANFMFSWTPQTQDSETKIVSVSFEARQISGYLRHAFSPEDCLRGEVPFITLGCSLMLSKLSRSYTVNMDLPTTTAIFNVRHLQDYYLFRSLWTLTTPDLGLISKESNMGTTYGNDVMSLLRLPNTGQSSDYRDTFNLNMRLNQIELSTDLGQAIGKAVIQMNQSTLSTATAWSAHAIELNDTSFSLEKIAIKMDGRYSGDVTLSNVAANIVSMNPFSMPRSYQEKFVSTMVVGHTDKIEAQVFYQYERILIFELFPVGFRLAQTWHPIISKAGLSVNNDMEWNVSRVKCVVSRRTVPSMAQMITKLLALIQEKQLENPMSLVKQDFDSVVHTKANARQPTTAEITTRRFLIDHKAAETTSTIRLVVESTFVTLMRYNFRDPDCAQVLFNSIMVQLDHKPRSALVLTESTTIKIAGFSVKKGTAKSITQEEERMWSSSEWFTFLASITTKNVVTVPATNMRLNTTNRHDNGKEEVHLELITDFAGSIDIALNFGLYRHLQDLVTYYIKAMHPDNDGVPETGSKTSPTSGTIPEIKSENQQSTSTTSPDTSAPQVKYVTVGDVKFDPQLRITGDATPAELINWLGVNKGRVPELVYKHVTVNLAILLLAMKRFS
ncbi:hypothetical protein HDV05_003977 [Chytridiales sp. JEL 0842]|nr:hypothetical protein HDV05_003977 [Chytridiales sp. JEL 0842]